MDAPERPDLSADAIIIGGGPAGLTLAAALGGAGLAVVLIDAESRQEKTDAAYDGRTSALAQGSKRVLDGIGVWARMADGAEPIREIRVSDGTSRLFLHYDHAELGDDPLGYIVENTVIRRALYAHLDTLSSARIVTPARVVALDTTGARARVTLDDGRIIAAPLAIAADGRRSPVRRMAGIAVTEWRYKQTGIVCTVAHEKPHRGIAHERFLAAGPLALLPMAGNRSSIVWTEREDVAPAMLALDDDAFSAELERRFGPWLGRIRIVGGRWAYPLALTHAERYVGRRVALLGDAARAIHPIAGQGFNLGLRDVAALAEVVMDTVRLGLDPGDAHALARYDRWRRVDSMALLIATDGLNRLFSNAFPPLRMVRDLGLAVVGRVPPARRFFMRHAMGLAGDLPRLAKGLSL
jgi:2-octaprenyl-6-methoxyphenol hydroxylase